MISELQMKQFPIFQIPSVPNTRQSCIINEKLNIFRSNSSAERKIINIYFWTHLQDYNISERTSFLSGRVITNDK